MSPPHAAGSSRGLKALRKLPRDQRDAILAAAAERAEPEYLGNRELTDFEAYSKEVELNRCAVV